MSLTHNGKFDIYDSAGNLDLLKCRKLSRTSILAQGDAIATDEMVELAEIVVPKLISELEKLQGLDAEVDARNYADQEESKRVKKLVQAVRNVQINARLQKVSITLPHEGKGDPIVINMEVPMNDWDKVPELADRIAQINTALEGFN